MAAWLNPTRTKSLFWGAEKTFSFLHLPFTVQWQILKINFVLASDNILWSLNLKSWNVVLDRYLDCQLKMSEIRQIIFDLILKSLFMQYNMFYFTNFNQCLSTWANKTPPNVNVDNIFSYKWTALVVVNVSSLSWMKRNILMQAVISHSKIGCPYV